MKDQRAVGSVASVEPMVLVSKLLKAEVTAAGTTRPALKPRSDPKLLQQEEKAGYVERVKS